MKKNVFLMLLALTPSLLAEEASLTTDKSTSTIAAPTKAKAYCISAKAGLMHTDVSVAGNGEQELQNLPSLLYGGTLGFNWDFMQNRNLTHSIGLSLGVFTGSQESGLRGLLYLDKSNSIKRGSFCDTDVTAIPLTIAYDLKKDISDSLSFYAGIRTGALIRKTEATGETGNYAEHKGVVVIGERCQWNSVKSTKVLPMLGLGAGVQMHVNDKWSINLSYDFVWTFGNDCDSLDTNSNTEGISAQLNGTSMDHRYYGTISFGVTRSF